MKKKDQVVQEMAKGQAPAERVEITLEKVKEWSKRDLGCAISFLNAIHSDPDMLDQVATFIYGRFKNAKEQEALKKQPELFNGK